MGGLEFLEVSLDDIVRINISKENAQNYIENDDKFKLLVDDNTGEKLASILAP
jgi:hypothetical protein